MTGDSEITRSGDAWSSLTAQAQLRRSSGVEAARLDGKVAGWLSSLHDAAEVSAAAHCWAAERQGIERALRQTKSRTPRRTWNLEETKMEVLSRRAEQGNGLQWNSGEAEPGQRLLLLPL